jgi:hypothetical protein
MITGKIALAKAKIVPGDSEGQTLKTTLSPSLETESTSGRTSGTHTNIQKTHKHARTYTRTYTYTYTHTYTYTYTHTQTHSQGRRPPLLLCRPKLLYEEEDESTGEAKIIVCQEGREYIKGVKNWQGCTVWTTCMKRRKNACKLWRRGSSRVPKVDLFDKAGP